jgi:GNAT superfamily N-acetyltransferase
VPADLDIGVSLRDYDESVAEAYEALFPGDPDKSPDRLKWRFEDNPHGRTRFAVATRGDRVVGMIALVPTKLGRAPGSGRGYQAIDTVVDPSCRGQGLFVKMGLLAQDPAGLGGDVLWGFPNANASPGWYGRLGWTNFGPVPLLMRPLRSSFLFGRVHPKLRIVDVPLIRKHRRFKAYDEGPEFAADAGELWRRVAPQFGIAVDRSGDWMRWRLFDKPEADYRCVGMKSGTGELDALVVTKIADKHGGRLCYCMEAIAAPGHTADLAAMLLGELSNAAAQGAEAALAWCPRSAPNHAAYRKAGFVPVPARLRPIEINFGARALTADSAGAAAADARWYASFLDSDTN